jgi:hypothetical protein
MHNKQIDGVMVGGLTSSLVDHGIQHSLVEANDFQIRICSFSAKYTALYVILTIPITFSFFTQIIRDIYKNTVKAVNDFETW